jgi:hypothetical protein
MRDCLAALTQIPEGTQPGKVELAIVMSGLLLLFSDRQEEKDSVIEWLVEFVDDPSQMQEVAALGKAQALSLAGFTLFGLTNTKYCRTRSSEQIRRGARFFIRSGPCWLEHSYSLSGWMRWFSWSLALEPASLQTLCYTCLEEIHDYALAMMGVGGVQLVKCHDS